MRTVPVKVALIVYGRRYDGLVNTLHGLMNNMENGDCEHAAEQRKDMTMK